MIDEQKLRELAEAATPGPWHWDSDPIKGDPLDRVRFRVVATGRTITQCYYSSSDDMAQKEAEWIATANPATITALLDELQNLRNDRDSWAEQCSQRVQDAVDAFEKLEAMTQERTEWRVTAENAESACEQRTKKYPPMLPMSDEQAEAIASSVYALNPVDGIDSAFELDWALIRAGVSHAKALHTEDGCPHGNAHIVHDCLRCGAPVCCGKCCAEDSAIEADVVGEIAHQLTKKLVVDISTARAAVDAAIESLKGKTP